MKTLHTIYVAMPYLQLDLRPFVPLFTQTYTHPYAHFLKKILDLNYATLTVINIF